MKAKLPGLTSVLVVVAVCLSVFGCRRNEADLIRDAIDAQDNAAKVKSEVHRLPPLLNRVMHKAIDNAEKDEATGQLLFKKENYKEAAKTFRQCAQSYQKVIDAKGTWDTLIAVKKRVNHAHLLIQITGRKDVEEEIKSAQRHADGFAEAGNLEEALSGLKSDCSTIIPRITNKGATQAQAVTARDAMKRAEEEAGRWPAAAVGRARDAANAASEELADNEYDLAQALFDAAGKLYWEGALGKAQGAWDTTWRNLHVPGNLDKTDFDNAKKRADEAQSLAASGRCQDAVTRYQEATEALNKAIHMIPAGENVIGGTGSSESAREMNVYLSKNTIIGKDPAWNGTVTILTRIDPASRKITSLTYTYDSPGNHEVYTTGVAPGEPGITSLEQNGNRLAIHLLNKKHESHVVEVTFNGEGNDPTVADVKYPRKIVGKAEPLPQEPKEKANP